MTCLVVAAMLQFRFRKLNYPRTVAAFASVLSSTHSRGMKYRRHRISLRYCEQALERIIQVTIRAAPFAALECETVTRAKNAATGGRRLRPQEVALCGSDAPGLRLLARKHDRSRPVVQATRRVLSKPPGQLDACLRGLQWSGRELTVQ